MPKLPTSNSQLPTKKNILLVGGGTGGHIFPLYPLAQKLLADGHTVHLIVNDAELDRKVINDKFKTLLTTYHLPLNTFSVHYLKTHKIDYHVSLRNLVAPFKILGSFLRTQKLIKNINPNIVFFKGGFVGFPVLVVLKYLKFLNHLPFTINHSPQIYLHDSDISAGKLTQLIGKNADHIFTNFGDNATPLFYWPSDIDPGIKQQKINRSRDQKPCVLIFGGSQGAQSLNNLIVQNLDALTKKYHITLVAGLKNTITTKHADLEVHNFMPQDDLIKAMINSDLVICRSGASMFQVLAAQTKCIAVPLPSSARNHQYHNAKYFADKNLCYLLEQNTDTNKKLLPMIQKVLADKKLQKHLESYEGLPQTKKIIEVITK